MRDGRERDGLRGLRLRSGLRDSWERDCRARGEYRQSKNCAECHRLMITHASASEPPCPRERLRPDHGLSTTPRDLRTMTRCETAGEDAAARSLSRRDAYVRR